MPAQAQRVSGVKHKFTAVKGEFAERNVLIVDDSIVRGTTSKEIVHIARRAGAKKVFLASCSPAIRYVIGLHALNLNADQMLRRNCHLYGIDLGDQHQLVAFSMSNIEISNSLGCDGLIYLPLPQLVSACLERQKKSSKRTVSAFEVGLFSGVYTTAIATPKLVQRPGALRRPSNG